ncbi:ABC transporter permease [Rhodovastum atsumiense]|uniref:ABC transporter permease n=1 Tax=Rhodovastum atsumiense TaxID=504468 RepID=A0A5M6J2J7_9PROT|nr:ABC transporter permease [Rhodovastum atsumiense]KAA5613835.1 ABC transporter permease [Rhodovastum atsumiense]CAH2601944.1 ABC transporter permease [Rhodovastum atsumiense]
MTGSPRVLKALCRTAWQAIPTVAGIVLLDFFLLRLAPGDVADVLAGEAGAATAETMTALRARFGLDLPALGQFLNYLDALAHFSLGQSPRYNMPVAALIGQRMPNTLLLMGVALALALVLGVAVGALMARFAGGWIDRVLSVGALLFYSTPGFWIGLMLIVLFSVHLGWLPSGGAETIGAGLGGLAALLDRARHMVLPALSLALFYVAIYARLTRGVMLEVQSQDFVRTARAKGLSRLAVTFRHALPNALLPVATMAGIHLGGLMGGAVVVETVYSWPGLGRLAFEAVMGRDFTLLLGILLLSSLLVVAVNALSDVVQAWLDPRLELR